MRGAPPADLGPFGPRRRGATLIPRGRPYEHPAVGSAMARQLQKVAISPAPDREALRAHGQGRAQGRVASDAFGTPDRSRVRDSAAPIGGMAGSEPWPPAAIHRQESVDTRSVSEPTMGQLIPPPMILSVATSCSNRAEP